MTATPKLQPTLALRTSASSVAVNKYVTLTGKYLERGVAVKAPTSVTVWSNASGIWKQVGTASYSSTSKAYTYKPRITKSASYQFRSAGSPARLATTSAALKITAKSTVALSTSAKVLAYGKPAKITGAVNSVSPTSVRIYRYKYDSKARRWVYKGSVKPRVNARTSTYATFSASVRVPGRGKWKLVAKHTVSGKKTVSKSVYRRVR